MVDGSPCGYVSTAKVPSCSFQMCRSVCASTRIRAHTCACTCVQACACVCAVRSPARGEKGMRDCAHYAHAKKGIQGKRRGGGVSRDRQENLDAHRFHPAAALPVSALRGIRQPPPSDHSAPRSLSPRTGLRWVLGLHAAWVQHEPAAWLQSLRAASVQHKWCMPGRTHAHGARDERILHTGYLAYDASAA